MKTESLGDGYVLVGSWAFQSHLGQLVLDTISGGGWVDVRLEPGRLYTMHVWRRGGESAEERFYGELRGVTLKAGLEDYLIEFVPTGVHTAAAGTRMSALP
ncbi:hypothetical protein [Streptomyces sp. NPDC005955]|uniref:hypothetical protein n=1 Tax=Streptomyces sp. NPDC005955 TaxID=3364738 RepID=UPI0036D0AE19